MESNRDLQSTMLAVGLSARDRFYTYDRVYYGDLSNYSFKYSSLYSNYYKKGKRKSKNNITICYDIFNYKEEFIRRITLNLN